MEKVDKNTYVLVFNQLSKADVGIIGTKIATQVLKNDDLVEVDADNGLVRVLEKVSNASDE